MPSPSHHNDDSVFSHAIALHRRAIAEQVNFIFGVAPAAGLQIRTCEFPFIGILNELVNDSQTSLLCAECGSATDLTW